MLDSVTQTRKKEYWRSLRLLTSDWMKFSSQQITQHRTATSHVL
jgi:hypothetical protein